MLQTPITLRGVTSAYGDARSCFARLAARFVELVGEIAMFIPSQ
jgi:hypothetical protein